MESFKIPNGLFKLLKSRGWQKSVIEAVKVEMQNTLKLTIDNKIAGWVTVIQPAYSNLSTPFGLFCRVNIANFQWRKQK